MSGTGEILFEQRRGLAVATLNRPEALNAVNLKMFRAFAPRLSGWGGDPGVRAVLLRGAGDRAFCAGGDLRAIHEERGRPLVRGEYTFDMFREEYLFIRRLHRFPKPRIALAHGITMGGGAGLSINGTFCVATETTAIAMPEVFIGSIPDVGAPRFLNACPGRIGLYLALTGSRVGAADALYCGLATHHVPQDRLGALTAALGEVEWRRGEESAQAGAVLARFSGTPGEATLPARRPAIDRCFGKRSVEAIVAALRQEPGAWAEEALAAMQRASPLSLKLVFADRIAVIDGTRRTTYAELWSRAQRLSGALRESGIAPGDRVAVLASNSYILLEAHYGVPLSGAVLVTLNSRLTADDLARIVEHSGARLLLHDDTQDDRASEVERKLAGLRRVGASEYEALVERAQPWTAPLEDERAMFALSYTSGTTASPKRVMYPPRGAYLQSLAIALAMKLDADSTYLWTLPMFHCNGWCFTWAVTAAGATHLCLRAFHAGRVCSHPRDSGVTHLYAAPTVLTMLLWHPDARPGRPVRFGTGGPAPTPAILARAAELGIEVTHLYGLTETYGPAVVCEWRSDWSSQPIAQQAKLKARQGVGNVVTGSLRVVSADGADVP